jgi:hypothetical protein
LSTHQSTKGQRSRARLNRYGATRPIGNVVILGRARGERRLVAVVGQPRLAQYDESHPVVAQLEHLIGQGWMTGSSQLFDVTRILPSRSALATKETSFSRRSARFDMRFPRGSDLTEPPRQHASTTPIRRRHLFHREILRRIRSVRLRLRAIRF